jgi:predicted alpha/beta hydrolase family esterase
MKKVFIIHGFEGSPNGGWRPWLMGELEKESIYACALSMPDPNNPIPSEWVKEIQRHVERNKKDQIYLIGHSLGVPAILRYLEGKKALKVKGIILVSGPVYKTSKKKVVDFLKKPFDFAAIRSNVKNIEVIHGDNDKSVSLEQGEYLAKELKAPLTIIKNGGHLNGSSGWTSLPQCLEALKRIMK